MGEVNSGYVTLDTIHYESLIRENAQLRAENDKLQSMLWHADTLINRIEMMYNELLNKIPQ